MTIDHRFKALESPSVTHGDGNHINNLNQRLLSYAFSFTSHQYYLQNKTLHVNACDLKVKNKYLATYNLRQKRFAL